MAKTLIGKGMQRVLRCFGSFIGFCVIFVAVSMVAPTFLDYVDKKDYRPVDAVVSDATEKTEIDYCAKKYSLSNLALHPRRNGLQYCRSESRGKPYDAERDYKIYRELLTLHYTVDGKNYNRFIERGVDEEYYGADKVNPQRKLYAKGTTHHIFYDEKDPSKIVWGVTGMEGVTIMLSLAGIVFALGCALILFFLRFDFTNIDWKAADDDY